MISIIVPVYNMQEKLGKCVKSVIAQTYTDWELLLIDDGSSDDSFGLCGAYAEKDKRIRAFHKKNGGVSSARNFGLDICRGEYVTFIDPDDYVDADYLDVLYNSLVKHDADMLLALDYTWKELEDGRLVPYSIDGNCLVQGARQGTIWGILYKKQLVDGVRFDESIFSAEDTLFIAEILKSKPKAYLLRKCLYHYMQYADSICNGTFSERNFTCVAAYRKIVALYAEEARVQAAIYACYARVCYSCFCKYYYDRVFRHKYFKFTVHEYRKYFRFLMRFERKIAHRIARRVCYLFPRLYIRLFGHRYAVRNRSNYEYADKE